MKCVPGSAAAAVRGGIHERGCRVHNGGNEATPRSAAHRLLRATKGGRPPPECSQKVFRVPRDAHWGLLMWESWADAANCIFLPLLLSTCQQCWIGIVAKIGRVTGQENRAHSDAMKVSAKRCLESCQFCLRALFFKFSLTYLCIVAGAGVGCACFLGIKICELFIYQCRMWKTSLKTGVADPL
jgi:hypothetical protein